MKAIQKIFLILSVIGVLAVLEQNPTGLVRSVFTENEDFKQINQIEIEDVEALYKKSTPEKKYNWDDYITPSTLLTEKYEDNTKFVCNQNVVGLIPLKIPLYLLYSRLKISC